MTKRFTTEEEKSCIFRVGFPEVFGEGSTKKDYEGKYSLLAMLPKTINEIDIDGLSEEGKKKILKEAKAFKKHLDSQLKELALKAFDEEDVEDGSIIYDRVFDGDKKKGKKSKEPIAPGYYAFNVWSTIKPTVQYPLRKDGEITDEKAKDFYAGCWARIFFHLYTFDNKTTGVNISLGSIKKCYDGQPMGASGKKWEDDDDDIEPVEPQEDDFEEEEEDDDWS